MHMFTYPFGLCAQVAFAHITIIFTVSVQILELIQLMIQECVDSDINSYHQWNTIVPESSINPRYIFLLLCERCANNSRSAGFTQFGIMRQIFLYLIKFFCSDRENIKTEEGQEGCLPLSWENKALFKGSLQGLCRYLKKKKKNNNENIDQVE